MQTTIQVGTLDLSLTAYYQEQAIAFDFNINASPSSQIVTAGQSAAFNVSANLLAGTTEPVALSVSGLPTYAQASFSPASGSPPFSSVLTVQTAQNTPKGTYTLTISATNGIITRTTVVSLQVNALVVPFDFAISASPSTQNITVGTSASFAVACTLLAGQSEPVVLAVSGLPSGATYSVSPSSGTPPFAATLTVQTAPNTPTGSYTLTVSGFASVDRSTTVVLNVNPMAPFDFGISASPASQSVTVGNSTSFAISASLLAGLTESITLVVVSGLPNFASAAFSPTSGSPPFSSTLTIQTSPSTPTGSYTITFAGIGSVDHQTSVTLVVNPVQVQRGTILVSASIGTAVVSNAEGEITDSNGTVMASFTSTPFSWDQAVVGTEYTVVCRVAGYADKTTKVTVQSEGASVPAQFLFVSEQGFPLWAVALAGGTLVMSYVFFGGRKGRRK